MPQDLDRSRPPTVGTAGARIPRRLLTAAVTGMLLCSAAACGAAPDDTATATDDRARAETGGRSPSALASSDDAGTSSSGPGGASDPATGGTGPANGTTADRAGVATGDAPGGEAGAGVADGGAGNEGSAGEPGGGGSGGGAPGGGAVGGEASPPPVAPPQQVRGARARMLVTDQAQVTTGFELVVAADGSYRWTAEDGSRDLAYDAATATAVTVIGGEGGYSEVAVNVPPGGPDRRAAGPTPMALDPVAALVGSLGRQGDERVVTSGAAERPTWRYDGPMAPDRLTPDSPDHVLAQVDQETGVLLQLVESGPAGVALRLEVERFEATDVARADFALQPPAEPAPVVIDLGFERVPLGEAADRLGAPLLVPTPPPGFGQPVVAVNPDVAAAVGADGDIASRQVAVMTWRLGFLALTVTQRDDPGTSDDPFGTEGVVLAAAPVEARVGDGTPLDGQLTVDPPAAPHLWAVAGDHLITVDGGLAGTELVGVARSLYPG